MKYDFALLKFRPIPENYDEVYEMFSKLVEEREYCLSVSKISHVKEMKPIFIGLNVRGDTVDKAYSELKPLLEDKCHIIAGEEGLADIFYYTE